MTFFLETDNKCCFIYLITPHVRIRDFDWLIASVFFTNLLFSNEYRSFLTPPGYLPKRICLFTLSAVVFAKNIYSIRLDACKVTIINAFLNINIRCDFRYSMFFGGICEKYQSWEWISLALRLVKFNILSTCIFRKYPFLTWYICLVSQLLMYSAWFSI